MDWVHRMNAAIDYVEDRLAADPAVDYEGAARIACCSVYHFQRMFAYMAEVSLSEYVRRRRLTLSAYELQQGNPKVIDVALKYGYDSPEAFARAFQQLHGTTPTKARHAGTKLKAYSRLSFQMTIRGVEAMEYRVEQVSSFAVVGAAEEVNTDDAYRVVPKLWAQAAQEGLFGKLWDMKAEAGHAGPPGLLGVCADGDHGRRESFSYLLSVVSEQQAPAGMIRREFPAATWVVFEAEGGPERIGELWGRLYTEWVPSAAYDLAELPAIECYLPPEENRNELWVAVVKKTKD